jgi:hypothetical protein
MEAERGAGQIRTLGAALRDLRPGSACVCCGATVQTTDRRRAAGTEGRGGLSSEGGGGLSCPVCGCEVTELSEDQAAEAPGQTLTRAA